MISNAWVKAFDLVEVHLQHLIFSNVCYINKMLAFKV